MLRAFFFLSALVSLPVSHLSSVLLSDAFLLLEPARRFYFLFRPACFITLSCPWCRGCLTPRGAPALRFRPRVRAWAWVYRRSCFHLVLVFFFFSFLFSLWSDSLFSSWSVSLVSLCSRADLAIFFLLQEGLLFAFFLMFFLCSSFLPFVCFLV